MSDRSKRLKTLLRVAGIKEKQAEAGLAKAEVERREADATRERNVERLGEVSSLGAGTVASLDARRQKTDLRIDAVLHANAVVEASEDALAAARERWHAAARQRRSMEELDSRERAVQAVLAARAGERALDDVLRARRGDGSGKAPEGGAR
jgi:flagellar export protein FliJ